MRDYVGPIQRDILSMMRGGEALYNESGRWYFAKGPKARRYHNKERCMALYVRGFIYAVAVEDTRTRYGLTERGKAV